MIVILAAGGIGIAQSVDERRDAQEQADERRKAQEREADERRDARDARLEAQQREAEARIDAQENRDTINRLESKIDRQQALLERWVEQAQKSQTASQPAVQELVEQVLDLSWDDGSIAIPISDASGTRLSENFSGPPGSGQRFVKLEIANVPQDQAKLIRMQLKLDKPFGADPNRSPVVGAGDVVTLDSGRGGYYFAGRDDAEAMLGKYPKAVLRLSLQ